MHPRHTFSDHNYPSHLIRAVASVGQVSVQKASRPLIKRSGKGGGVLPLDPTIHAGFLSCPKRQKERRAPESQLKQVSNQNFTRRLYRILLLNPPPPKKKKRLNKSLCFRVPLPRVMRFQSCSFQFYRSYPWSQRLLCSPPPPDKRLFSSQYWGVGVNAEG